MTTSVENTARKQFSSLESERTPILIVDDDPDFLDMLTDQIGQIPGAEIEVAHDPHEALGLLTKKNFKLIVSDWSLSSSKNAAEVLTRADDILADTAEPDPVPYSEKVPVLFMSGSEKVGETHRLHSLRHFEPVSFILKRCGPPMIGILAQHILARFCPMRELQPC